MHLAVIIIVKITPPALLRFWKNIKVSIMARKDKSVPGGTP
jgi:hypothetical protein